MPVAFTRPCIFSVAALGLLGGCSTNAGILPLEAIDAGAVARVDAGPADRPPPAPTLLAVQPGHGSFLGGTEVTLRGSNFADGALVRFGGNLVQPRYTTFVDRNRITVLTPAGRAGVVDVEVEIAGRVATLPGAYRYDSFYVDPPVGPTTGGARVSLHGLGTQFRDGMRVTFDGAPCTALTVTGPELASCLTPEHPDGRVEVVIEGDEPVSIADGYTYADSADSVGGGLSGGALAGSITVTVLDATTGDPVPSAFVFLNNEPGAVPPSAGQTSARGQVTLSPPTLTPPITVTASERCHTTTTIQSFDARNATIYLQPLMIPGCGSPGMPMGMPQRAVYPATVTGELVWAGPNEFAPNPWSNIPEPREGFRRVAYVWVSRPDIFTPDPTGAALSAQRDTVLELVADTGGRGYAFTVQARPAAVAVYALAGLENVVPTGSTAPVRFTPWVMGVARSVLGAPRATIDNVVIDMNIPLDHETPLEVAPPGGTDPDAPDLFHASGFIDLGGEGIIPMPHATVTGLDGGSYRLSGLPAFNRNLADARLTVHARLASGDVTGPRAFQDTPAPCTALIVSGITSPDETVRVGAWLGIPRMTAPEQGDRLPADRTVHFAIEGASPDLLLFTMQWNATSWQHIAPGAERAVQYPDLSSLMGLSDLPAGSFLSLSLVGLRLSGFDFNRFTYTTIGPSYWTAYAGRGEYLTR